REVAVDGADRDLLLRVGHARTAADARAAAGLDDVDAGRPERLEVAARLGIVAHGLAAELDVHVHARRDAAAALDRFAQHLRVEVEVVLLAGRARAGVGDVDRDL